MPPSGGAISGTIQQDIIDYLRQTPKAVAVLVFSFFCGQLWLFIIFNYRKKGTMVGDKFLKTKMGTTALVVSHFETQG
jgi:hypothetical protein